MGAEHLVCNDCGCKFQIHDSGKGEAQACQKKETGTEKAEPIKICCPECRSYKITTA
jgi:hypothetical protein